jgi:hypothetical protein
MAGANAADHRRIAELAAFLDPEAFANLHDQRMAKRRQAAWREAFNRIGQGAAPA